MSKKRAGSRGVDPENLYESADQLSPSEREKLAGRLLSTDTKEELAIRRLPEKTRTKLGLPIPVTIYIQDPLVAERDLKMGLLEIDIDWEPGLIDGPASARVAVVDYDADTNVLTDPARWAKDKWCFIRPDGQPIGKEDSKSFQFHQLNVWAIIQKILNFFEDSSALGRRIPWAFEGNRLIVVPHAGWGENAFYDRNSKSVQFYYCGTKERPVYTCLSHDIVAHETGHAILDGIRPYYNEQSSLQTAAFHEFFADLTAILVALRNNVFRHVIEELTKGDLTKAEPLTSLAEQFSRDVMNRDYLRSAINGYTMEDVKIGRSPHDCSQALTGAMFDIMEKMAVNYINEREKSPLQALYYTIDRFHRVALQPLDYCPPVDIQFEDYTRAVLRCDQLSDPQDPHGYREIMRKIFEERHIPTLNEEEKSDDDPELRCNNINHISSSRTAAYHFLHEKRKELNIPECQDFIVVEPYTATKEGRACHKLPPEIVLQYIWREDVRLKGPLFGRLDGEMRSLLCGGTLVYDNLGNLRSWRRKPGTRSNAHAKADLRKKDEADGEKRWKEFQVFVANSVNSGLVGLTEEETKESVDILASVTGRRAKGARRRETFQHRGGKKEADNE